MLVQVLLVLLASAASTIVRFRQECPCTYHSSAASFSISNADVRHSNKTDCLLVFFTGSAQQIVELRFDDVQLTNGCSVQLQTFPHLSEAVIQANSIPEDTICAANAKTLHNSTVFSSNRVMGLRIIHSSAHNAFLVKGHFRFLQKDTFTTEGLLLSDTYCNYNFLPPLGYRVKEASEEQWMYFHSPRYPAKYPAHVNCLYKFIGSSYHVIEVIFVDISLGQSKENCIGQLDKLVIYDSHATDKLQIIDVICSDKPRVRPKFTSSGPNLLIEFEASSNRTSQGFRAQFRFIATAGAAPTKGVSLARIQGQSTEVTTHAYSTPTNNPNSLSAEKRDCSLVANSSDGASGWFQSPNFPNLYPKNTECNYLFFASLEEIVVIKFTYFDVEGILPCEESTASDYVEFSNFVTTDRKFQKACGQVDNIEVKSDGAFFRVTFRSNDRFDKTGFRASYAFRTKTKVDDVSHQRRVAAEESVDDGGKAVEAGCDKRRSSFFVVFVLNVVIIEWNSSF